MVKLGCFCYRFRRAFSFNEPSLSSHIFQFSQKPGEGNAFLGQSLRITPSVPDRFGLRMLVCTLTHPLPWFAFTDCRLAVLALRPARCRLALSSLPLHRCWLWPLL